MKSIRCPVLPLLAVLTALGLALAFASPAEARWEHYRGYNSEYNCPAYGQRCGPEFRGQHYRQNSRGRSRMYYNQYHRERHHGTYQQERHWRNQN